MVKVGLSVEEITTILEETIANGKSLSNEGLREIIAKAIVANNEKVAKDMEQVIASYLKRQESLHGF